MREFTPELNQQMYDQFAGRVNKRADQRVGQGRSEALSRGIESDVFERSLTAGHRAAASEEIAGYDADLGYKVAGLNRDERLQNQYRTEDYGRQKERDKFLAGQHEKLSRLGWANQLQMQQNGFNQQDQQNDWGNMGKDFLRNFGMNMTTKLGGG